MEISLINAIIWLQIAVLEDYRCTYAIFVSIGFSVIALGIYIYKIIRRFKIWKNMTIEKH